MFASRLHLLASRHEERVRDGVFAFGRRPTFPTQPAAIHFVAYDYVKPFGDVPKGSIVPLGVIEEHCTTVYKVQEAFSAVSLPEGNVYGNAIKKCLYGE